MTFLESLKAYSRQGLRFNWTAVMAVLSLSSMLFITSCSTTGKRENFEEAGNASWYGQRFHGRQTANGERFDMHQLTAAHRSLAFGTLVEVTSETTGKSVIVRINDRGPYFGDRVIDLSYAAARRIGIVALGTDRVQINKIVN